VRYIFLGNSVTFGYNTLAEKSFTSLLESRLNLDLPAPRYQIANLAVPGYNVRQEYNKLKEFGESRFERLFVGFCFNDVTSRFDFDSQFGGQDVFESIPNRSAPWQIRVSLALKNRYALCYWGDRILGQLLSIGRKSHGSGRQEASLNLLNDVINGTDNDLCKKAWAKTLEELDLLRLYAEELDVPLTILIYPYRSMYPEIALGRNDSYPAAPLTWWADRHLIDYIDFIQVIREYAEETTRDPGEFFMDMNHFNSEGHRTVAETLYHYVNEEKKRFRD
jgi:lysophospholipase L1-like esterase